jgi:hypothetical protein
LVLAAHGAKHCGSELGADTTFGGAAVATPADSKAITAAAIGVRYGIKSSSYDSELRPPGATASFVNREPGAGTDWHQHTFGP